MSDDLEYLKAAIHDLNNRIGVILATSELLEMDAAAGKPKNRCRVIEEKAMEARDILLGISRRYFE